MSQEGVIAWKAASSELHNDSGAHIIAIWLLQKDIHNKHVGVFLMSAYIPIDNTPDDVWNKYSDILTASLIWKCKSYILNIGTDANSSMETGSAHCTLYTFSEGIPLIAPIIATAALYWIDSRFLWNDSLRLNHNQYPHNLNEGKWMIYRL